MKYGISKMPNDEQAGYVRSRAQKHVFAKTCNKSTVFNISPKRLWTDMYSSERVKSSACNLETRM